MPYATRRPEGNSLSFGQTRQDHRPAECRPIFQNWVVHKPVFKIRQESSTFSGVQWPPCLHPRSFEINCNFHIRTKIYCISDNFRSIRYQFASGRENKNRNAESEIFGLPFLQYKHLFPVTRRYSFSNFTNIYYLRPVTMILPENI